MRLNVQLAAQWKSQLKYFIKNVNDWCQLQVIIWLVFQLKLNTLHDLKIDSNAEPGWFDLILDAEGMKKIKYSYELKARKKGLM